MMRRNSPMIPDDRQSPYPANLGRQRVGAPMLSVTYTESSTHTSLFPNRRISAGPLSFSQLDPRDELPATDDGSVQRTTYNHSHS